MIDFCLSALISGIINHGTGIYADRETNTVFYNEKQIVVADKYSLLNCNSEKRFSDKIDQKTRFNMIYAIEQ